MQLNSMKQCAMQEIHALGSHASAEEAMLAFCKLAIGTGPGPGFTCMDVKYVYSFYIFSQPLSKVEHTGFYRPYGADFAKFILDNGLGTILETEAVTNWAFHTAHLNKFWIWTVDQKKMKLWYDKRKPKPTKAGPALPSGFYKPEPVDYGD